MRRRSWLAALVVLAGCAAASHERSAALDPRADWRVAVLPFVERHDGDHPTAWPLTLLTDHLPPLADEAMAADRSAAVLRAKVHVQLLQRTGFEVVPLPFVDARLEQAGVDLRALGPLDERTTAADRRRAAAARALGPALGADLVVLGDVTAWGREFWGVQSHATAGLTLEVRSTLTGAVLYRGAAEDTAHSGLSQVPLPLATDPLEVPAWVFVELVRGLSTSTFHRLSDDVAAAALDGLAPSVEDVLEAAPPRLADVAHAACPREGEVEHVVVARGEPGARATFRLGRGPWAPMTETAAGVYRGSLVAVAPAAEPTAEVRLVSPSGGLARATAGARLVRLTAAGPVPADVTLGPREVLLVICERRDALVAVALEAAPPVIVAPGEVAALRFARSGPRVVRVRAPDGEVSLAITVP